MFEATGVTAGVASNSNPGYCANGNGAGASLAVRSGERGSPVRLSRARHNGLRKGFMNDTARAFTPLGGGWRDVVLIGPGGVPATPPTISGGGGSGGGFDWSQVFGVITQSAPAIITAIRGQGVPPGYYPSAIPQGNNQQYSQIPPGYAYQNGQLIPIDSAASAGAQAGEGIANLTNSVSTFVTQNPLLVLGGVVGLLLLFRQPPSRR